ncbi:MAG: SNF2-related:Helicase, C-terminal:SWIM Zn-finger [Rhodocyclales bacterium]|nr:SNF2-related:Helicase, C-terminal:SWIM Zn-finger [Rhodocyclales bacterium]
MSVSPSPARNFTKDDVLRWFGKTGYTKGLGYLAAVNGLQVSDSLIRANVKGTALSPYKVRITFGTSPGVQATCSCPIGYMCKHGAATLLAAIEARSALATQPDPQVIDWLKMLRDLSDANAGKPVKPTKQTKTREQLFYVLDHHAADQRVTVSMRKARPDSTGRINAAAERWDNVERALTTPPKFVVDEDLAILRLLWVARSRDIGYMGPEFELQRRPCNDLLTRLLATGRCLFDDSQWLALHAGISRTGRLVWQLGDDGRMHASAVVEGIAHAHVLPCEPPWYVDAAGGECAPLDLGIAPRMASRLLTAPPLRPLDAAVVALELSEIAPDLPRPDADAASRLRRIEGPPRLRLRVLTAQVSTARSWRGYAQHFQFDMDFALPDFDYQGIFVAPEESRDFHVIEGETVQLVRDRAAEAAALEQLGALGFQSVPASLFSSWTVPPAKHLFGLADAAAWQEWMPRLAPILRTTGWALRIDESFRHHIVEIDELLADVEETESGWFDLSLGFDLEGQRIALAPLLANFLQQHPHLSSGKGLDSLQDTERMDIRLEDGQRVRFTAARLKPVLRLLIDLFDGKHRGDHSLRISRLDAPRLEALSEVASTTGLRAVEAAAARLRGSAGVAPVAVPAGLGLTLRPYQLEGLAWLQHLRSHDLAGILADDMGLGKTAQTLAHLLIEKHAGRLDRPSLVVVPTSLVFNWKREAERIAPMLSVLILHGPQRDFGAIPKHDIVLTTYPLVWRDAEQLQLHNYHLLILDEAQTVKNAASRAAAVIRKLDARHRLCITGTPMENHLGELWAQFDFLLPGFLGDSRDFTRRWRTPIEKGGDSLRRELLARRVKPFLLRRRKDEVASELPPKNIVLRTTELEGGQRDLYEVVRSAMDEKVRNAVAEKGFKRSHIVILDALLKLRQVCCDPRLLNLANAHRVKERAKLDLLMNMLPELVEEGRRILLFSQFTSMLDLIVEEVDKAKIPYVMLTGQSKKREGIVQRFQDCEVPLFLISLKAGGVGLNLTAADTVIHFDPWWNPAVEDQATDRAHRIGQTKSVYVYKLIVAGSIEERIVALQEKKAALASAVLSGDSEGDVKFSEEDLANLFAPLPELIDSKAGLVRV